MSESDNDCLIQSTSESLAENELGKYEFLVAIVIWYDILSVVNVVSKQLQSKNMVIDDAMKKIEDLVSFFKTYRETRFSKALESAKEIAIEMNIDPVFVRKREIIRKRYFDENQNDVSSSVPQSLEESFKTNYFLAVVDQAIVSLNSRFEQYQEYEKTFGFLFTSDKLRSLGDNDLKSCCLRLEAALKHDEVYDIDGIDLYVELKLLVHSMPKEKMGPVGKA
ncbi:zinc finger MYM-type protein 1 [Artemisia annua]|uniref:Zinc finger MYM-type protein 1 n=1 Tax=Artemisia annua TaxID=35608 RepID=A0A2U1MTX5_ARTAN|nr:zinc finger MYM-type protein 1 [Artemisia annua]